MTDEENSYERRFIDFRGTAVWKRLPRRPFAPGRGRPRGQPGGPHFPGPVRQTQGALGVSEGQVGRTDREHQDAPTRSGQDAGLHPQQAAISVGAGPH